MIKEELDTLGWAATELPCRAKGDAGKIGIARCLRTETAVTLKWIAAELHKGAWTQARTLLANRNPTEPTNQTDLNLCQ